MSMKRLYLLMAIAGTIVPWLFFASYFRSHGLDISGFTSSLFVNGASAGFSVDIMISILVFWIWSYFDSRELRIDNWWLVLPAGFFVGLSLALPLYLYIRENRTERRAAID